jgi:ssRNA-specific RNase YbeY (16S rRNA maturation enzyme)
MAIKRKDNENNKVVVDKLRQDVNNKLLYWLKRVPRYNELNTLINCGKNNSMVTKIYVDELEILKSLFNINKTKILFDRERYFNSEKYFALLLEDDYKKLIINKDFLKKEISLRTSYWYISKIEKFRNNIILTDRFLSNEISELGIVSVDDTLLEYNNVCMDISKILDLDVSEIFSMKSNKIKFLLNSVFENIDISDLKLKLIEKEVEITKYKSQYIEKPNITNVIFSAFGDIKDPNTEKILKEIMFSAHILNVYAISHNVCLKNRHTHMTNDAVGFGLEALLKAINKWYETQLIVNHPLSFDGFMYKYINYDITNGLRELNFSGIIKYSNYNTIRSKNRNEIDTFLKKNPQYSHLDENTLFEMLLPNSKVLKRVSSVSNESTINEYTSANNNESNDTTGYDIFGCDSEDINSDDILESVLEYDRMLNGLNEIFNTGKFVVYDYNSFDEPLYEESNEKLFTVYDKELFLMDIGFKFKHKTNKPYTLKEMSEVLKSMYNQNGINTNRVGEEISFGTSTISIRLKKIKENIKLTIQNKPSLINGFKYFVTITGDENFRLKNINNLIHMSNLRENSNYNLK